MTTTTPNDSNRNNSSAPFLGALAGEYAERSMRVAAALAKYEAIVLPFPRQLALMVHLDELRLSGLGNKGKPQDGMRVLAASRAGKTVAATQYRDYVMSQPGRDSAKMPVLIVPLEALGTSRSFFVDGLRVFGDGFSTSGTQEVLKERFKQALRYFEVELLIVDEVQHLAKRHAFGRDVTDTLKRFLDDGDVPVAFFGTEDAMKLFERSPELNGRLTAPCHLPALDWFEEDGRKLFLGFVSRLDDAMVEHGVLRTKAGLADEMIAERLCEASNGLIGQLSKIVKEAVREAVRRDADTFDVDDLAYAVDAWSMKNGFLDENPFLRPAE